MPRVRSLERMTPERLREVEGDWCAGLLSIRVIAARHRVDPDALRNFAVRAGWQRASLSEDIRESARRTLVERTVFDTQSQDEDVGPLVLTQDETVERYGQLAATIIGSHREDAARGRLHASRLERELYRLLALPSEIDVDLRERLLLLRSAAETLRCLAQTQKLYMDVERQAWSLDEATGKQRTYDDYLDEIHGEGTQSAVGRST